MPPLLLIACAFFLPTIRVCNTVESPASLTAEGLVWIVPWYLCALVLAAVTVVALVKLRAPSRAGWIAGGLAVGSCGCVAVAGLVAVAPEFVTNDDGAAAMLLLLALPVCVALGGVLAQRARRHRGWPAWTRLLLVYWLMLLPLVVLLAHAALEKSDRTETFGIGAYVVLAGIAALGVVLAALFVQRRIRQTEP